MKIVDSQGKEYKWQYRDMDKAYKAKTRLEIDHPGITLSIVPIKNTWNPNLKKWLP